MLQRIELDRVQIEEFSMPVRFGCKNIRIPNNIGIDDLVIDLTDKQSVIEEAVKLCYYNKFQSINLDIELESNDLDNRGINFIGSTLSVSSNTAFISFLTSNSSKRIELNITKLIKSVFCFEFMS